jgi:uncharacterized protein (DUF885 family)
MRSIALTILCGVLLSMTPLSRATGEPPMLQELSGASVADTPAARLDNLIREYDAWRWYEYPEEARAQGKPTRDDAIAIVGVRAEASRNGQLGVFVEELNSIDPAGLDSPHRVAFDRFRYELTLAMQGFERRVWLQPLGRARGPHRTILQIAASCDFSSESGYETYIKRLTWIPQNLRDTIEVLREAMRRGNVPARFVLRELPAELRTLLDKGLGQLAAPFATWPDSVGQERRDELKREFWESTEPQIRAALTEYTTFVTSEYIPACRESIACSAMADDGAAFYACILARATTSSIDPIRAHEIGTTEVDRLGAELAVAIRATPWAKDPSRVAVDDRSLLQAYLSRLRDDREAQRSVTVIDSLPEFLVDGKPSAAIGRARAELLNAALLVVDTGIHAVGWRREQATGFLTKHTHAGAPAAILATEEIISEPGVACAPALALYVQRAMRSEAEKRLGEKFDAAAYEVERTRYGPLPLVVLEAAMARWVEAMAAQVSGGA